MLKVAAKRLRRWCHCWNRQADHSFTVIFCARCISLDLRPWVCIKLECPQSPAINVNMLHLAKQASGGLFWHTHTHSQQTWSTANKTIRGAAGAQRKVQKGLCDENSYHSCWHVAASEEWQAGFEVASLWDDFAWKMKCLPKDPAESEDWIGEIRFHAFVPKATFSCGPMFLPYGFHRRTICNLNVSDRLYVLTWDEIAVVFRFSFCCCRCSQAWQQGLL